METKYEYIQLETVNEHVHVLTINNPPLNVLKDELLAELDQAMDQLMQDSHVRALIITGAGEKAFVAGADISQFPEMDGNTSRDLLEKGKKIFDKLETAAFPVIGALNGFTLGGGLELALACDFRVASDNAKLGLPEVGLGIYPGYGGTQRLARLVGVGKAKQLVFVAEPITAEEAYRIGVVEELAAVGEALNVAKELAEKIATKAPLAISGAKKAIHDGMQTTLEEAQKLETDYFIPLADSEDKQEGVRAFIEKRKPNFVGR